MREHHMILPQNYNDGMPIPDHVLASIEQEILKAAGGFTRVAGWGAWLSPTNGQMIEAVWCYTIALPEDNAHSVLQPIAVTARGLLKQEAIYLCVNGNVEFV